MPEMTAPALGNKMAETVSSQQPTAIVTGGSRGLGRGIAQALVARGVHVIECCEEA
jgi:NADP-dependent 3-hydroxy acid dehydrogenase YdfG